jgi:hypothetical protein
MWLYPANPAIGNNESPRHAYPNMPHPRYASASVLIHDFDRNDGLGACDRIFIIGGRGAGGELVPETDVFNLRYNVWETDWKGLDEGELETYTPPGGVGAGTTIVINTGSKNTGLQSIKAGKGIEITGDSKNPVVSATGFRWG